MVLSIRIKKGRSSPSVLTVERPDRTVTYAKLDVNFEIHDIAHYVVEKQMKFKKSFYGLLSKGFQISDFQLPKEERPKALWPHKIPQEALVTEHLVNLLTIDFFQSESKMDISETLSTILMEKKLSFPKALDRQKIVSIQNELSNLMAQWNALKNGQELKLELKL